MLEDVGPYEAHTTRTQVAFRRRRGFAYLWFPTFAAHEVGNTGYTQAMAKVMVSLPDDLLRAVDAEASRRGTTRSGLLRELAEGTLRRRTAQRAQRMREIRLAPGERRSHGGGVAELVKTHRPQG